MCRVFSCVVGRGCLLWPVHFLGKTLLVFALLHSIFKAKFACYSRCFLTSYFFIPVPYNEKDIFFGVLVLEGLVGLHSTTQLQLLQHYWWGIDLDYCDIEWFALETNRAHSVVFEMVSKYCILESFVGYEGHSISSKRFLPTVVDTMVIWVKFTHSRTF